MNTTEYRQPTHREELERELVHGASSQIAHAPESAAAIANGIKTVLDELAPVAPHPVALASAVLYPAIERAMGELSKLHPEFNMEVNRAFNLLHDAFWSECPAPASAAPKRPETPAVEPAGLPVIDPGPDSLEREIQAKGLTAPRVTPADLQANIVHTEIVKHVSPSGQVLRWAVLTTRNGFAVTGRPSASVSSANDNAEIGEKVAIDNAKQELWPLMGYELRSKLAAA